jgi:hypothetical protein
MWKNIFIESCFLSALIFGGFYLHSIIIQREINLSDQSISKQLSQQNSFHMSGSNTLKSNSKINHISGTTSDFKSGHLSGKTQ